MGHLSAGWKNTTIGEIARVDSGVGFPKKFQGANDGMYPVYKVGDISRSFLRGDKRLSHSEFYVDEQTKSEMKGRVLPSGSTVFAKIGEALRLERRMMLGRAGLADNNVMSVKCYDSNLDRFVYYFLRSTPLAKLSRSTTVPSIRKSDVEELVINIRPEKIIREIVDKLDDTLGQVATIQDRLDQLPAIIKQFRQSVLAAAVSGQLTKVWRGESDFFSPEQKDLWQWQDIPASWSVMLYPQLVESRLGKMLDKAKNSGIPTSYLGNINVRWFGFDLEKLQKILVNEQEQHELTVAAGDVLICEGGEPGRAAIWQQTQNSPIVFQKALHRARVGSKIIPEWLVYNLKNDCDNKTLEQLFTGTTIKHLTGKALRKYPLRVPPVDEQKEIVRLVEEYFSLASTLENNLQNVKTQVDNLTQSILAKAFRGELVDQQEGVEPAEVLLKKIAKARAKAELLEKDTKKAARSRKTAEA